MKKILFIMKYPIHVQYTLKQKFMGQIDAITKMGYEAWYITFDTDYIYVNCPNGRTIIRTTTGGHSKQYIHTLAFIDIYLAICKLVSNQKFDLVYFRKSPIGIIGRKMCSYIKMSGAKLVVEITSYPEVEKPKNKLRALYFMYSDRMWKKSYSKVDLFTLIGKKSDNYYGYHAINIENGVAVDNVPVKQWTKTDNKIHLLALASMCIWHGYDRLIQGLADYSGNDKERIIIDMVGNEGDGSLKKWKKLTQSLSIENQVIFHGRVEGDALTDIFNQANVGVCSLGLYRMGFQSGSILKLREFMARGLPFIYAADDPSIDPTKTWYLKVSNDDLPIDISRVIEFANNLNSDVSSEMREYAIKHMSWESQFERIIYEIGINK